ncbi:LptF/LptG family permease [Candidatus Pelagibacter sp.]|jgi:lipopolysaccharide export system permease protein|uniref:LptF/LptG family permease n=1 Tax=uncultured Candidatus Pelagibacter sp. TaxID=372654 RepID=UPI00236FD49B|nr:LptF/LptG family permease [uncultured Candidatus Pelagibacter sp.]MDC0428756.1 LptF/LptG family permease [Candidatus Pelagibacter sp.]MDC1003360.1 LptF/LptG family permease [Candidatus Pelagibacter sp.]
MKKIIFRKLLLDCLTFFFLALLGISLIIWVFQAVNFLDIMIEDGRNYNVYFNYTLLNFPKIISRILPFALFISFSYTFIKYEANNELIIFWNHGVSKISIVNFFFWISILIMLIQILLMSLIVPKSQEMARSELRSSNVDYFEGLIKPKKFNDTVKGLTIFAEDKNENGELKNIYIKKNNYEKGFQITFAKKGVFELKGNKKILVLYDGQTLNQNNNNITNFDFSRSDFGLGNMDSHLVTHKKIQEQSTISLIRCIKSIFEKKDYNVINCNKNNPRNIYKTIFKRLINPFYLPVLILISLLFILTSKENLKYNKYKYSIFLLGLGLIILSESSLGYISNNLNKNILILILPIFLTLFFYIIFIHKLKLFSRITK